MSTGPKYPKIPSVFKRVDRDPRRIDLWSWCSTEVQFLADAPWEFTEKVDGTNVRVHWNGHTVLFGGRTDNADLPPYLMETLNDMFSGPHMEQAFEQVFGDTPATLYGEGYGAKINGGGSYNPDGQDFILFDVLVGRFWLRRDDVEEIATALAIETVPLHGIADLVSQTRAAMTFGAIPSGLRDIPAEGLVGRPTVQMFNRMGDRIQVKIKPNELHNEWQIRGEEAAEREALALREWEESRAS